MAYTAEEAKELIRELTAQKHKLANEEVTIYQRVEKADKVLRLTWFLVAGFAIGIIAVTTFYLKVNSKIASFDEMFRSRELRLVSLEAANQSDLITAVAKLVVTEGLRTDIDRLTSRVDIIEPQNRTMTDMLKRGQSNKEAFFLEKGFEAPSIIPHSKLGAPQSGDPDRVRSPAPE